MAGGPRYGMVKWWTAYRRTNGLRTDVISPYHGHHVRSLAKNFGHKVPHGLPRRGRPGLV